MGDVDEWLERLGLSRYRAVFAEHDIDRAILPDLTDHDLEKLGLSLGHRKKLLRAIAELGPQGSNYGWFTEGFDTADLKDAKALLVELM